MKKLTSTLLLSFLLITLLSNCAGHSDEQHNTSHNDDLNIALDGSEKWQLDESTRQTLAVMRQEFATTDITSASTSTLIELGQTLKTHINTLIEGCTMTGPAHSALHQFLMPYISAVHNLAETGSLESAQDVHFLLQAYPNYFE